MKIPKMAKIVYRQMPPLGIYPNKSLPPGQKLGCESPRVGEKFFGANPWGCAGGMVMAKIDSCITKILFASLSVSTSAKAAMKL